MATRTRLLTGLLAVAALTLGAIWIGRDRPPGAVPAGSPPTDPVTANAPRPAADLESPVADSSGSRQAPPAGDFERAPVAPSEPETFAVRAVDTLGQPLLEWTLRVHLSADPAKIAEVQSVWRAWTEAGEQDLQKRELFANDASAIPVPDGPRTLTVAPYDGAAWASVRIEPPVPEVVEVELRGAACMVLRYLRNSGEPASGIFATLVGLRDDDEEDLFRARTDDSGRAMLSTRYSSMELRERFDALRVETRFEADTPFLPKVPFEAFDLCSEVEQVLPGFGAVEITGTIEDAEPDERVYVWLSNLDRVRERHSDSSEFHPANYLDAGIIAVKPGTPVRFEPVPLGCRFAVTVGRGGPARAGPTAEFSGPSEDGQVVELTVEAVR